MSDTVIIIQPPLVQLNGPYPSGAYLAAFVRSLAGLTVEPLAVRWVDASNRLFRAVFSHTGVSRLFEQSRDHAAVRAMEAASAGDEETAYQLRRYLSFEDRWISWIDGIVSILCSGDRELSHALVRSPHAPRGARMDAFLAGLDSEPSPDDARMLATLALEDLADFITSVFDHEFSLVRYAESIAASERSFAKIEAALDRPLVREFIQPMAERLWAELESGVTPLIAQAGGRLVFCLSVPFPGCLVGALALARSIRARYGSRAVIAMGGGYVNTELRTCENEKLFAYVDHLVFDRGYAGLAILLARAPHTSLESSIPRRLFCPPSLSAFESDVTAKIVPDYSDINFSSYPRLADNPNPMHRLWSDGAWLKAYLAHGCYWHRCSFCDVSLDYVCGYRPVDVPTLYAGLRAQTGSTGARGIHLVDEAAPPRALRDFATENLKAAHSPLTPDCTLIPFWGNIRFERTFSRDLADYLAAGGLLAVSGGIEIASPEGFKAVDKGIDLENLVAVCAAFKEAGVLVHAYLIYGYWNEGAQGVVDAAEVMRQLFAAGLVDSAFWHKFVLTRHSRVYREWEAGKHRGGSVSEPGAAPAASLTPIDEAGDFADNDLRFEGEDESSRYTAPLDAALSAWMSGDGFETPVRKWFPYPMPSPKIAADQIDRYIESYEARRDAERNKSFDSAAVYSWIASRPVVASRSAAAVTLVWWHLGEEFSLESDAPTAASVLAACAAPSRPVDPEFLSRLPRKIFKALRAGGLVKISPL